mmetsp:Transcript_22595/g.65022  ORF Transcript_22595/g.65022 Transcript_22595/m.65022 type:complete len:425 (+) Transcript_22595:152-1426(+)|eukprot:CAMPEP_0181060242 /NCGR_PEP_ID=MMETSP1070-20121207/21851_1 /TAXON_ID=265543 /ORGANISM="Minutocellus polymorphus, Strain NH13" /LENGTH=424 /DNA_ID=CAMNT_0023140053 /DNA_START=124 /DNA_END=1398 /DNA_ORIENTATION=+
MATDAAHSDEQDTSTNSAGDDKPTDSGPRTKKVRIDLDATKVQPIATSADSNPGGSDGSTARRSRHGPPPPVSFTATLPSTGLDVLLIGRTDLCRPLAESMLSVTFDRQKAVGDGLSGSRRHGKNKRPRPTMSASANRARGDTAIEALRRHLCRSSAADTTGGSRGGGIGSFGLADAVRSRHVRLVESLSDLTDCRYRTAGDGNGREGNGQSETKKSPAIANKELNDKNNSGNNNDDPRVDHAVIVLTPSDPFSSTRLRQTAASLHPDYALNGRITIVYAVGGSGDSTSGGPAKAACPDFERLLEDVERGTASKLSGSTKGGASKSKISKAILFVESVPVLRCNLKDSHSRLAVARMILQRTKMGSRGCMGADDGLDVVVSNAEHNGAGSIAAEEGGDDRGLALDSGLKSAIGGISPLFFSSIL